MWLSQLTIQQFRNIETLHLSACHPQFNVIWGENGAGKTTVLEAINMLGTGRSFRTTHVEEVVRFAQNALVVRGSLHEEGSASFKLGIQRHRNGETELRLQEQKPRTVVELARCLPLQVFNAHSFGLLEAGPSARRQFLDQALFHVEPLYHSWWQRYRRILKQRNAYLKSRQGLEEAVLFAWDEELARLGEDLGQARARFVEQWLVEVQDCASLFGLIGRLTLDYQQGWPNPQGLLQALHETHKRDKSLGYTTRGPHRAELTLMCEEGAIKDFFSRGQLKRLVCAMLIGRHKLVKRKTGRASVFLIDDLPAEMDAGGAKQILAAIRELEVQAFMTTVDPASLEPLLDLEERVEYHLQGGRLQGLA